MRSLASSKVAAYAAGNSCCAPIRAPSVSCRSRSRQSPTGACASIRACAQSRSASSQPLAKSFSDAGNGAASASVRAASNAIAARMKRLDCATSASARWSCTFADGSWRRRSKDACAPLRATARRARGGTGVMARPRVAVQHGPQIIAVGVQHSGQHRALTATFPGWPQ